MSKPLDNFTSADSPTFGNLIHRGPNGYWKPIYPNEIGRALKHVEADYNYKLLTASLINYRIYPGGQIPSSYTNSEDFSNDENKVLTLKKDGTTFYWTLETVQGGNGNGSGGQIYNSDMTPGTAMTQDHGALPQGTLVDSLSDGVKTLSELMDSILFPTAYPTYQQPSATLTTSTTRQEIGDELNVSLGFSAYRGLIVNTWGGANQGPFAGPILNAEYEQNNSGIQVPVVFNGTTLTGVTISNYVVGNGNNTWKLSVTYDIGDDPLDSVGAVVAGAAFPGGTKTSTKSFSGVYPIYLGVDTGNNDFEKRSTATLNTTGGTGLTSMSSGLVEISQNYLDNAAGTRHRIAVPQIMGSISIEERNFATGTWGASGWDSGTPITFNVNSNAQNVNYVVYTKIGSSSGGDSLFQGSLAAKYRINF